MYSFAAALNLCILSILTTDFDLPFYLKSKIQYRMGVLTLPYCTESPRIVDNAVMVAVMQVILFCMSWSNELVE